MNNLPWFPLYAPDWLSSNTVNSLTYAQQGAFIRLLTIAWMDETCTVPNDIGKIKKLLGWVKSDGNLEPVLGCFKPYEGKPDRLYNVRLMKEFHESKEKKRHYIERAKKGAAGRWPDHQEPRKPVLHVKDRTSKGLSPLAETLHTVADKYFPPVS